MKIKVGIWKRVLMLVYIISAFVPDEIVYVIFPGYFLDHNAIFIGMFAFAVLYYFLHTKRHRKMIIWFALYCAFVLVDTVLAQGDVVQVMLLYGRVIATCMLVDTMLRIRDYDMLSGFTFGLNTIVTLNLISIVSQVNLQLSTTLGNRYLLGFDNGNCLILLPTIIFNLLLNEVERRPLFSCRMVYVWIVTAVSVFLIDSATTTAGFVLFLLVYIASKADIFKLLSKRKMILIVIAVFIGVNLLRLQEIFSTVIVDWLGKDLSFTGRVFLWDKAIIGFLKKPVFGHGVDPAAHTLYYGGAQAAHNFVLDLLFQTGVVGFALFSTIIIEYLRSRERNLPQQVKSLNSALNAMLFSFLIMMLFESYSTYSGFALVCSLFVVSTHIVDISTWERRRRNVLRSEPGKRETAWEEEEMG